MFTLMLTSKGLAAVPRASLVILSATLAQFGLPLEGVALILGVDALMDMATHVGEPPGQLPRDGRDGAVGGRVRAAAGEPVGRPPAGRSWSVVPPTARPSASPSTGGHERPCQSGFERQHPRSSSACLPAFVQLLCESVNGGASLGFLPPLTPEDGGRTGGHSIRNCARAAVCSWRPTRQIIWSVQANSRFRHGPMRDTGLSFRSCSSRRRCAGEASGDRSWRPSTTRRGSMAVR